MRVLSCAPKGGALRLIGSAAQMIQWVLGARIGPQPHQPLRGDRPAQRSGQRNEGGVAAEDCLRLAEQQGACGGGGRGGRIVEFAAGVCVAEGVGREGKWAGSTYKAVVGRE